MTTHRVMIAGAWFTKSQIARAFKVTRKNAASLCDRITAGIANGGYGCNIIEKAASAQDSQALEEAARKLAHILPSEKQDRNREGKKMTTTHQHRAKSTRDEGWVLCVTPEECAAKPRRQSAHGNIVRVDVCGCGAQRLTEINCTAKNRGPWIA